MRILLLGSGGRESALGWALAHSRVVDEVISAPGNAGLADLGETLAIDPNDAAEVLLAAEKVDAGLVVIGPEAPLVAGVGDALRATGRNVFGPGAAAARIEGSKSHAKQLMGRVGIETAAARTFDNLPEAVAFMDELGPPYVIKADGLAAGKGVVVTEDRAEALEALEERLVKGVFGAAGATVVIEEFLDGQEVSLIALTDGRTTVTCEPAQDYKRIYDNDAGPNTGGMGSYSPVPACPPDLTRRISSEVIEPMVAATAAIGAPFSGAIYAGLALTSDGPKVVEFNARFGDPETQALVPRLDSDLGEAFVATAEGELEGVELTWKPQACVSLVLASGGYPGPHRTGIPIEGIVEAEEVAGVSVFQAGTELVDDVVVTSGGRVLAVSALGDSFAAARDAAYEAANRISFDGKHLRSDIGLRAVDAEGGTA